MFSWFSFGARAGLLARAHVEELDGEREAHGEVDVAPVDVAPEGVAYERTAPEYATQERVEMVAPARSYYVPVAPRCSTCGY